MNRGTHRRVIAACVLATLLVLAMPQSADARLLGPRVQTIEGAEEPRQELNLLARLWQAIESLWAGQSVFIVPD